MGLIRFLLACIVVLSHTDTILGYNPIPSDLAVQCFYVISGFYMSLILNEKYPEGSNKLFYTNRALKIYPIYWIILLLLLIWNLTVYLLGYPSTLSFYFQARPLSFLTVLYLLIANIFIIGLDWTFLMGINKGDLYLTSKYTESKPNVYLFGFNSIAWTVGVELLFYVFAPFIVRKKPYIILLILSLSLGLRLLLSYCGFNGHPWDYMFFPTQLMFFMGGCISYHLYTYLNKINTSQALLKLQYLFLITIILFYSYINLNDYIKQVLLFALMVIFIPSSFLISKSNKVDRYLGDLSYPIYISQMLVIGATRANAFPKILGVGFTTLVIVLLISIVLEHYVNKPIEIYRQKRVSERN